MQQTPSKAKETPPAGGILWRSWVVVVGALCLLGASGHAFSADPGFNFDDFTKNKPFKLNTLPTTPYGPPWADIVVKPENFLACKGASIALCYYSGPETPIVDGAAPTPCELRDGNAIADCTCYRIPEGPTYYVDINAILNLDVYLDTVKKCGTNGENCQPKGLEEAPVCKEIKKGTLIPGADLISTFSLWLDDPDYYPIKPKDVLQCPAILGTGLPSYAGCMTAPCTTLVDPVTGLPPRDPITDLELVSCACPAYPRPQNAAPFQVGYPGDNGCVLGGKNIWSAAYTVPPEPPIPPLPGPDCWPDAPQRSDSACPLLPLARRDWPPVPATVGCKEVCKEYKQSNQNGVEIGFTCDATLCTAMPREFHIVAEACGGLRKGNLGEILKLELAVGYSCSASQLCGCEPNKKTNEAIFNLNKAQFDAGITPQCGLNLTLCGTKP